MQKNTKKIVLIVAWAVIVPVFVWQQVVFFGGSVNADTTSEQEAADKVAADEAARQKAIDDANDEKEDIESAIKKAEKAKAALQKDLGQIQGAVASTQKVINNTKAVINETTTNISRKEAEVNNLNDKIQLQKTMLKGLLQQMYYNQGQPVLNVVLTSKNFADVFSDTDHLLTIEDKLRDLSGQISQTKEQVEQEKIKLAEAKEKHEEILDEKVDQKQELVADQIDVQGDIEDKNATIAKLQKQLVELQGDLNALSGKSYSAKNIRDAVEFASGKTGVPEGVLYGFLKMETNLGANTGKCTYDQVERVSLANYKKYGSKYKASIALLYKRHDIFDELVKNLGYSKDKKVSCSPSGYIGQGGAMGIPQFMSDVWQGYSARISSATGHRNPDPWDLTDGVMAMAIKLKSAGATSSSPAAIKKASINYLGTYHAPYYNGIVYWSKNYKLLFE
ncbi:MAG: hypothetical protein US57_C0017G0008 [Candidatus Moranbacteria bacterium GW2011_GWC2_37_73]|nr:MAG: coiled-coil [Parcubacteria group bacterium GW2011_GWC1_36_108]KKQ00290.1 MAG: hypothetical protein US09_C0015G0006 [Candidatus Moranbacteria bacterium GW2011_GWD1_36_198]KKQ00725.1 MAG: hypothetical protein US10_C0027G0008 [Candidatus Moranbacteria bacterium GW2011_GWD2_36_198]KKQ39209.1 MAG: hypothetical protein US57_C0017G0008 [Candidatus Moranbacteria bacterium GW2011_GWC2_37_73]HAS00021.1 hypothetical protein [Candidatus Moranbacteria bacterium]